MAKKDISRKLSYLLRHHPEQLGLEMDVYGWVDVQQLIDGINAEGRYSLTRTQLDEIVANNDKGRFRFSADGRQIRACQGHTIEGVVPPLEYRQPPDVIYHGTTLEAYEKIVESGEINKMKRHAVHMRADMARAWASASRWHKTPVLLKIDAKRIYEDGLEIGVTDNDVWCADSVPVKYIIQVIRKAE